ncbi:NAD(P)H-dependent oxidoreductase [Stenotrophomonas maltophilia]|uniref:NADPH-dependent FMN reductase n=1 Tax=Stenotrophomonas maltophilia TaxID=40324 RepID=UPI001D122FEB|nr:NAD(P)H-dependent oxidoreductase [Stenotrophomonas maltophilia]UXF74781.1 NAD(P)H-dependent oxidoreductase [Stenotrophomonas maltophilia]
MARAGSPRRALFALEKGAARTKALHRRNRDPLQIQSGPGPPAFIPLFDEDLEAADPAGPAGVKRLRTAIAAADGVLIATPEYSQSLPGVLKNTLDWLSRDDAEYRTVLSAKPVAIIGATPGHWGTKLAQSQLRHTLTAMGALTMASPQLYVAEAAAAYDDDAEDFDAATRKRLQRFLEGFQSWVQLLQGGASRA